MSGFRLPTGGRIDRSRPLRFAFDGRAYDGYAGDTLASALLANGVAVVGRSFKYHRPRGVFSAGAEEPNALVQLGAGPHTEPNLRATQVELHRGLVARSVNAWPSAARDLAAVAGWFDRLLVAGFYYKTFFGSQRAWQHLFEPAIRRMAGLGRAPRSPDPDRYDHVHRHCDVLVAGAGPAGLAAAAAAARTGARVILADERPEPGGSLPGGPAQVGAFAAQAWADGLIAELSAGTEVTLLPRTTVFGLYDHGYACLVERRTDHLPPAERDGPRQRLWHLRAREVVIATGAHERPLVFAGNDRPGVMLASAARDYLHRHAVSVGRRIILFATNDGAYRLALEADELGLDVAAIVDARTGLDGPLPREAWRRGITVLQGHAVTGTFGGPALAGVHAVRLTADGRHLAGRPLAIEGDLLAVAGGWNPTVHLFAQARGRLRYDAARACFVPAEGPAHLRCAGAANGTFGLAAAIAEGLATGAAAAAAAGFGDGRAPAAPGIDDPEEAPPRALWAVPSPRPPGRGPKRFVDLQSDVTAADVALAAREGFDSVELLKRYTTIGMGTDQGKSSNVNALALLAGVTGRSLPETGTTTFRPPYTPVTFGAMAGPYVGRFLDPVRVTALHERHVARGAVFEDVGQWKRPRYFPRPGENMREAVARECRAVRTGVGVLDASTLGKIDIQGPDAGRFLDRIYTNLFSSLAVGRCRYGLMCRDDGMVFDDGVTTRLGESRFHMTTTTGNAGPVLDWLEEWLQTEWPDLRVYCTSVTEQWATVSLAGPKARDVLARLAPGLPLDRDAFPFLSMREATVAGVAARVFRISFTGELSYEINVPWNEAGAVWEAVLAAGAPEGIAPYGTEAMHVLRAEKGFIVVGHETDGSVTPLDLGMDWILSKRKDFLGRRALARPELQRGDRRQLVGLLPEDGAVVLAEGAQVTDAPHLPPPTPMLGHVTSSYWSETLGRGFALALLKGGRGRIGETATAWDRGTTHRVRIVEPVFYDPGNERRDG